MELLFVYSRSVRYGLFRLKSNNGIINYNLRLGHWRLDVFGTRIKLKERKPLEKVVYSGDYDSEDEVALVDNEMASFLAKMDGYGTQSLLEQWKESYENDDYEYDPYDNDMYEGQEIPDKLQAICDNLDITVRGHRKK
nr:hypothetical protein [Tanacetum cinerariifolium]